MRRCQQVASKIPQKLFQLSVFENTHQNLQWHELLNQKQTAICLNTLQQAVKTLKFPMCEWHGKGHVSAFTPGYVNIFKDLKLGNLRWDKACGICLSGSRLLHVCMTWKISKQTIETNIKCAKNLDLISLHGWSCYCDSQHALDTQDTI